MKHFHFSSKIFLILFLALLAGCGNLIELRNEIREANTTLTRLSGQVLSPVCPDCPTIVVALGDHTGKQVTAYRVLEHPGAFDLVAVRATSYLFAFHDNNGDFEFQADEPYGWLAFSEPLMPGKKLTDLKIDIQSFTHIQPPPEALGNLFHLRGVALGAVNNVQLGKVVDLDHPRFDADMAGLGMWQPLRFLKEAYAGIYFLEPYSPPKIPVVFIHGINGSPRDFAALIAQLDPQKFQPWVFYYPSGLDVGALGDGLLGMLTELQHRYDFGELHIVAHSMGGLVSRQYLDACERASSCSYVRSFVSISTPFGGHAAAQSGVDYSPVVMPAWRSMAPGSRFLKNLFVRTLPPGLPHYLLFGYRNDHLIASESGDGVISLESQLRNEAQLEAVGLRGFNENHVSILGNRDLHAYVNQILLSNTRNRMLSAQK